MNIELTTQNNATGVIYDISDLAQTITVTTTMTEQAGKLTFNYFDDKDAIIQEGSPISLTVNKKGVFFGYITSRQKTSSKEYSVTAYDQLFYFKNKDTRVFIGMTASQIFEKICKDTKIAYKVKVATKYVLPETVEDNQSYFSMVQGAIDATLINTGNWYIIRDNFGIIEFDSVNNLKTMLYLGDESLATDYAFKSSIETDTYNQIKLIRENTKTKKRDIFIVKDSSTVKKWGLLQYFEKMDEAATDTQIGERAAMILKLKNRVTKTLTIPCLGDLKVFAGVGIILGFSSLVKEGIELNKMFMVLSCTHTFANDMHTMSVDVQVSI